MNYSKIILVSIISMTFLASKAETEYVYDEINGVFYSAVFDPNTLLGEASIFSCYSSNVTYEDSDSILVLEDYFHGYPVTRIDERAFEGCKDIKHVVLPAHIKAIGPYAFFCCSNLNSIEFKEEQTQLTTIGAMAFSGCMNMKHFTIPESVTGIGTGAFLYSSLQSIDIPANVKKIDKYAFAECHDLSQVTFHNGLDSIGDYAFMKCKILESVDMPETVTAVGRYAFACCRNLKNVVLSPATDTISNHAFAGCYELGSIHIPDGVRAIGERAFSGAKLEIFAWEPSPNSYYYPSIGYMEESYSVFLGSMRDITIGSSVTELDVAAFAAQVPESITCMAPTPPTLVVNPYYRVFSENAHDSTMLYVPRVLVNDYKTAHEWMKFKNIVGIEVMGSGDVNGDGLIDENDVMLLFEAILGRQTDDFNAINADVNGDGELDIKDVTALNDMLLSKS